MAAFSSCSSTTAEPRPSAPQAHPRYLVGEARSRDPAFSRWHWLLTNPHGALAEDAAQGAEDVALDQGVPETCSPPKLPNLNHLFGKSYVIAHNPNPICSMAVCLAALRSRALRTSATGSSGSWPATT